MCPLTIKFIHHKGIDGHVIWKQVQESKKKKRCVCLHIGINVWSYDQSKN